MKQNRRILQSIQRASDILDNFTSEDSLLGLADIAKRMELPKSTVQGLLYSLEALGYLEQDPASLKYKLGPKLFHLGMKYLTGNDTLASTRVYMERLSYRFQEPVNVGMLIDNKVVIVMRIEPEKKFMSYPLVGSVIPAHSSSIGKTLLAWQPAARQKELVDSLDFIRHTDNTITSKKVLTEELKKIRETGVSFDNEESAPGLACVGAGVFNKMGQVIVAFTLTGRAEHIYEEKDAIIEEVKNTSQQLSRQLGFLDVEK